MKLAPPTRIYSWTDGYVAIKHRAEVERESVTINPDSATWERWPRTTGSDVIVIAAFFDPFIGAIADAGGSRSVAARWAAALEDVERYAPFAFDATYPANRGFWRLLATVAVHLASLEVVPPPHEEWQEMLSLIGSNPSPRANPRNSVLDLAVLGVKWPPPFGPFPSSRKLDDLYFAQWKNLQKLRGDDRMAAPPGMGGGTQPIPRVTNGDVVQLADFWTPILDSARKESGHNAVRERWDGELAHVAQLARTGDANAPYAKANSFFRALEWVAIHTAAVSELPSDWDRFTAAVSKSVHDLPENLGKFGRTIVDGLEEGVEAVAKGAGSALKVPLLIGGGVLAAYLIFRNGDRSTRAT